MSNERRPYSGLVAALREHHERDGWPSYRQAADAIEALTAALGAATKALIAERDCCYDSYTNADGNYHDDDHGAKEEVAELDALIDQCRIALGVQSTPAPSGSGGE